MKTFVVGILAEDGRYLAERRHKNEEHFGGLLVFPGGLVGDGEAPEKALAREMKEELGIVVKQSGYIGEFYYEDGHKSMVYLIKEWAGEPAAKEAESITWVEEVEELSNEFDRRILQKIIQR